MTEPREKLRRRRERRAETTREARTSRRRARKDYDAFVRELQKFVDAKDRGHGLKTFVKTDDDGNILPGQTRRGHRPMEGWEEVREQDDKDDLLHQPERFRRVEGRNVEKPVARITASAPVVLADGSDEVQVMLIGARVPRSMEPIRVRVNDEEQDWRVSRPGRTQIHTIQTDTANLRWVMEIVDPRVFSAEPSVVVTSVDPPEDPP